MIRGGVDPAVIDPRTQPRRWTAAAVVTAVLVYAWIAAGFRPFTATENAMVAVPIVIAVVLAARQPSHRRGSEPTTAVSAPRRGTAVWVVLLVALVAWELLELFSSPREAHPTLSSVADTIMSVHVGRAAMFALWLAAGARLALPRSQETR